MFKAYIKLVLKIRISYSLAKKQQKITNFNDIYNKNKEKESRHTERWLERITDEELARIDEYVEKAYQDDISDISESFEKCKPKKIRENSWVKKKRYRKKLMKKFLSVKPDMTPEECFPMEQTSNAIHCIRCLNY